MIHPDPHLASAGLASLRAQLPRGAGRFDPFGLVTGYRMYAIHAWLNARSDEELAALGHVRGELPRLAAELARQRNG